ncbi:hypothetical protein DVS28_a0687 [Euzebya pacifica]|uniref:Uncharacterized protein n=1 Tax=Euzebya pacifica TaxID=1608957 RepID=A0A346XT41_9ACTN|nr:hypothetical protein [Euzebya pacifica]AXV05388.1 hypothetical protein DVS28_a0687 [Euzebya pacifica]
MSQPETIVRKYLTALKDPSTLRDDDAIQEAESALGDESDPIERLKLQQKLAELNAPSMNAIEDEFVVHAKAWADEAGLTGKAFEAEGVPGATLRRAGFDVAKGRKRGAASSTPRKRSSRTTQEDVINAMPKSFTLKSLREATGGSPAVVRKAVDAEIEAGRVADAGPDPDHSGPGRAATLYRRT